MASLSVTKEEAAATTRSAFGVVGSLNEGSEAFYYRLSLRGSAKGGTLAYSTGSISHLELSLLAC